MKKIFYSIFTVCALLFTASCSEDRGTTTEVVHSNEDENVNPSHIRGYGDREPGGAGAFNPEADQMYGYEEAEAVSNQMASDLDLEGAQADKIVKVYYDRNQQLSELEQRYSYSETNRMGGNADNTTTAETDKSSTATNKMDKDNRTDKAMSNSKMSKSQMETERKRITDKADMQLKAILTPEQYRKYEQNRTLYENVGSDDETVRNMTSETGNQKNTNMNKK